MMKLMIIFPIIFFIGCVVINNDIVENISINLTKNFEFFVDYQIEKICYSKIDETLYVLEPNTKLIHIYHKKKKINTIGGVGFEKGKFNKLVDITISPEEKLLTLDSFTKKIARFNKEGKWLNESKLKGVEKPILFDINLNNELFVYDEYNKEIFIFNDILSEPIYNFGKFQFETPTKISCNNDFLLIYDSSLNKTLFYNTMGHYEKEEDGFIQIDKYNQRFILKRNFIEKFQINKTSSNTKNLKFALSSQKWEDFKIQNNILLLNSKNKINIYIIEYEN